MSAPFVTLRSLALEPLGLVVLSVAFLFGLSDGATGIAFRPRLVELGISSAWALGLVQASLTAARYAGLTLYERLAHVSPDRAGAIALGGSAVFSLVYALHDNAVLAVTSWLIRIVILAAYFPVIKALVSRTVYGSRQTASALSAVSVVTSVGMLVFSGVVGVVPLVGVTWSLQWQLVLGAIASVVAGSVLVLPQKHPTTHLVSRDLDSRT